MCFASSSRRRGRRRRERNYCHFTTSRCSRVLRRSDSSKGRQLGLPSRTSNLIGAGHIDVITYPERRNCFVLFSSRVLSAPYSVFFPSFPLIDEAGTEGDIMSYLDAPDA